MMGITVVTPAATVGRVYDVVVVGAGVAGAIVAKQLSARGKTVLIIEAGTSEGLTAQGQSNYVESFYGALDKHTNSPYPFNRNALTPTDGSNSYFEEKGPFRLGGSYTRIVGGTTMHWEGKAVRMLPEDFELKSRFGQGLDWPISYQDLEPYYRKAEYELGVSGDAEEERQLGIPLPSGYVFPNKKISPSYLDEQVRKKIQGATVQLEGQAFDLRVSTFPQARNGEPNPDFVTDGLDDVAPPIAGVRCQGNASCTPICPIQAKYDARRTLLGITGPQDVHLLPRAVASKVKIDPDTARVSSIEFKHYDDKDSPQHIVGNVQGRLFVLTCNAIENTLLMLASDLPGSSGLVGRNLMDHSSLLTWALMPEPMGARRGPLATSGIGTFRKGRFRSKQAAFAIDIRNDGWGWGAQARPVYCEMPLTINGCMEQSSVPN